MGFVSSMRNNAGPEHPSGVESLRSLRIRYWYETLRQRAGLNTAYQLENYFEPESFARDTDGSVKYYRNKWNRYELGRHLPQSRLLKKVEEKAPGSIRVLQHPLWSVLDPKNKQVMQGEAFLRQLLPAVQEVLFMPVQVEGYSLRAPVSPVLLERLERRASLDVLACLAWMLRATEGQSADAVRIANALHNVLIIMALELHALKIALPLLGLFIDRILPLGVPPHHRIWMIPSDYLHASGRLNIIACQVSKKLMKSLDWAERVKIMQQLLQGDFGLEVPYAMRPSFELDEAAGEIPAEVVKQHRYARVLREWGWECIRIGRLGAVVPPIELLFAESYQTTVDLTDFMSD